MRFYFLLKTEDNSIYLESGLVPSVPNFVVGQIINMNDYDYTAKKRLSAVEYKIKQIEWDLFKAKSPANKPELTLIVTLQTALMHENGEV